jgi:tRNA pseudouridine38-40 synthase
MPSTKEQTNFTLHNSAKADTVLPMRWKCICAYDGTDFEGWQRQPNGNAVQNYIEAILSKIFSTNIQTHGSGRTDAGVHATGQCFHFDADWAHPPEKLLRALHAQLPTTLQIKSIQPVSDDFHARFSVTGKRYKFHYILGRAKPTDDRYVWACRDIPLDLEAMNAAAQHLVGTHDFTAYSASHGQKDHDPNPVKTVHQLAVTQRGKHLTLTAEGSGFLYKMVRSIAGALYAVGRGRLSPDDILEILESKQRTHRIVTAPGKGLSLDRVFYK